MVNSKASEPVKEKRKVCMRCGWDWKADDAVDCPKCGSRRAVEVVVTKNVQKPKALFPTE